MLETKKANNTVLLTGGHAGTTALAVIQKLKKDPETEFVLHWVGVKRATEGSSMETLEYKVFPGLGVHFHTMRVGRLQRKWTRHTLPSLLKVPIGFFQAFSIVRKIKPNVIVSFGGFAAFPVVFSGWLLRIPIIIHEQTSAVGLANRLSAPFATKVAIAREGSKQYFPSKKTYVVGNPVVEEVLSVKPKKTIGNPPIIYISTGSRASQNVNIAILGIVEKLLNDFRIEHITGDIDFEKFKMIRHDLAPKLQSRYTLYSFVDPKHLGKMYMNADIVVGRGGANTIAEIMVTRRPAVLIPIPWTRYDEQTNNAQLAEKSGIAVVVPQSAITSEKLYEAIIAVAANWFRMVNTADDKYSSLDRQASERMIDLINELLKR